MKYDKNINSGTYQLYIKLSKDIKLTIGKLGDNLFFPKGNYVYTGSALKNLQHRVERHLRKEKKLKWHIDYLLINRFTKIYRIDIFESSEKTECSLNLKLMSERNGTFPIAKFGSSDCKKCKSHLIFI